MTDLSELVTPEELVRRVPGTTEGYWAQLRYTGKGPKYLKPSPRKVLYFLPDVQAWLAASERQGTAESAVA